MSQSTRLAMLAVMLLLLGFAAMRLRDPAVVQPPASIVGDRDLPHEQDVASGRLSQQPTILKAKPMGGEAEATVGASPRHWESDSVYAASAEPVFPTGNTFINPGWFDDRSAGGVSPQLTEPAALQVPAGEAEPVPIPSAEATGVAESPIPVEPPSGVENETRQLVTEANDSFWRLSEKAYGVGRYYRALFEHNRQQVASPDRIDAGIWIEAPPLSDLRRLYPQLCPSATRNETPRGT